MYSNKDITIIINTFNSEDQIYSCLDKIDSDVKVIIVENSNNIKFKKEVETKYSNVNCELANDNLGYGKGNNLGIKKVKTKFALILNPDAKLKNNTLKNFFKTAHAIDDFAIIGPGNQDQRNNLKNQSFDRENIIQTKNVKGFAMFLNLHQFQKIGFFDENFFIYFEEIDLCRRLKNNNKKIYLDINIEVDHIGGSSHNKQINYEMELSRNWHWMWSTFYYHKKYEGFLFALSKVILKLISSSLKIIYYSIIKNQYKKNIYFHRFSGLINSIMGKKSWYRPKLF
tara:strand:+ start:806 stop:1657 length:852 start_codon:yes stop_codon:yes gene_type:complete